MSGSDNKLKHEDKFDFKFQIKILALLVNDSQFCEQYVSIIQPNYFTEITHQQFAEMIIEFWTKYSKTPTLEAILEEIETKDKEIQGALAIVLEEIIDTDLRDAGYYTDRALKFCQRQSVILAIKEAASNLKEGNVDGILPSMEKALQIGQTEVVNPGFSYWEDVFNVEIDLHVPKIPTLLGVLGTGGLDDILKGGLERGALGIVMMPTGRGKSVWLLNVAGNAVIQGYNVAYISLELQEKMIAQRFNIFFSGVKSEEIDKMDVVHMRDQIKNNFRGKDLGKLLIKTFPTKSVTIRQIESFLKNNLRKQGWFPDLIIIDYLDIVRPPFRNKEKYEQLEEVAEEMRAMAQRNNAATWTAGQVNRSGSKKKIINNDDSSSSYSKLFVADVCLTANPSTESDDSNDGLTKIFVAKNRQGKDQMTIDFDCDFERMKYSHVPNNTVSAKALFSRMKGRP